jgi:hypothetical protein
MAIVEKTPPIDPEVLADLETVCNTKGIVRDPDLLRRITERADRVRQEHGERSLDHAKHTGRVRPASPQNAH